MECQHVSGLLHLLWMHMCIVGEPSCPTSSHFQTTNQQEVSVHLSLQLYNHALLTIHFFLHFIIAASESKCTAWRIHQYTLTGYDSALSFALCYSKPAAQHQLVSKLPGEHSRIYRDYTEFQNVIIYTFLNFSLYFNITVCLLSSEGKRAEGKTLIWIWSKMLPFVPHFQIAASSHHQNVSIDCMGSRLFALSTNVLILPFTSKLLSADHQTVSQYLWGCIWVWPTWLMVDCFHICFHMASWSSEST